MPRSSSVRTPWIVEPAGEQTLSLSTPGCWFVSSTILAVPSIICAAYWIADALGRPHLELQHDMKLWWPHSEAAIAALLGEGPGETRLFYCDPRRSDQKGACERNHVEIRKLLPKGSGLRFDRLAPADLALAMSHVNSEPRGALGFATPARAFRAMLGEDAAALLDAYGVEDVALGDLDLTPGLIERARAERGDAPLA